MRAGTSLKESMNLVSLDAVQQSLMAALDLATTISEDETADEKLSSAAREVMRLVSISAN